MKETFFGPWRITLDSIDLPTPLQSFVVSGSDNADGRHRMYPDTPFTVAVSGNEWTIALEYSSDDATWEGDDARKTTAFLPQIGLTVSLDTRRWDPVSPGTPFLGMRLLCTSLDPAINPEQTPNPFDFTLPGD